MARVTRISVFLVEFFLAAGLLYAQCSVTITGPKPEESVGPTGPATGTAVNLPKDTFLWVLARRDDEPKNFFWPQRGVAAKDLSETPPSWKISVHYGVSDDVNALFRIVAIVVDSETNQKLEQWRENAPANGYAPYVGFPSTVESCPHPDVIVKKAK